MEDESIEQYFQYTKLKHMKCGVEVAHKMCRVYLFEIVSIKFLSTISFPIINRIFLLFVSSSIK